MNMESMYQSNPDLAEAPYARDSRSYRPYSDDMSDADGLSEAANKASKNYMLGINYSPDGSEWTLNFDLIEQMR